MSRAQRAIGNQRDDPMDRQNSQKQRVTASSLPSPTKGLKLRINLTGVARQPAEQRPVASQQTASCLHKKGSTKIKIVAGEESGEEGAARRSASSIPHPPPPEKENRPAEKLPAEDANIKLTVRLRQKSGPSPTKKKTAGPKILLSVRRSEDRPVDIEGTDGSAEIAKEAPKAKKPRSELPPKRPSSGNAKRPFMTAPNIVKPPAKPSTPHPFSTVQSALAATSLSTSAIHSGSNSTTGTSKLPLPSFRASSLTRVPIAASNLTASLQDREEERLFRTAFNEVFSALWPAVTKPESLQDRQLLDRIIPYWLLLAPMDSHSSGRLSSDPTVQELQERAARVSQEQSAIKERLRTFHHATRNKEIASELLILEQRLCLEEEKFLYAKLKSEYNKKVTELLAHKRNGGPETSSISPGPAFVNHSQTTSTAATMAAHQQRILPKIS